MECKFINHGIALAYQETVKPCCVWQFNEEFKNTHSLNNVNLATWHQHKDLQNANELLKNNIWPENCSFCKEQESNNRQDSIRLGGINSYGHYSGDDITLEIRPGSVCNFACQTCWPAASSRVAHYHNQVELIKENKKLLSSIDIEHKTTFQNFDFLLPIIHRIKSIVLLGGEPFYDKNCLSFLEWWNTHSTAELIVFTNGSILPLKFLETVKNKLTLVFSIDAVGIPAEYIRFGTNWETVWKNYNIAKQMKKFDVRVNITQSVYNYVYLDKILDLLINDWPNVVSFGPVTESHMNESVIPIKFRGEIISQLEKSLNKLQTANIEIGQKHNAINAIAAIINNLNIIDFDSVKFNKFKDFVIKMDTVKKIDIRDFCPEVARYIY